MALWASRLFADNLWADNLFVGLTNEGVDMADQVEISLPKTRVNERSQFIATVRFRTRSSAAASTPTTVHYKLSNLQTGETITDWTSVTAASEVSITIPGASNQIRANSHSLERMELLVAADRGLSTESIGRRNYQINNVYGRRD